MRIREILEPSGNLPWSGKLGTFWDFGNRLKFLEFENLLGIWGWSGKLGTFWDFGNLLGIWEASENFGMV